jgi:Ca2+-binding EF-hand superfamily protein
MSLQSLFNEYDKSQSGYLDIDELILMIGDLGLSLDG